MPNGSPTSAATATLADDAFTRGLANLTPEERCKFEAELRRLTESTAALAAEAKCPELREAITRASRSLGDARDAAQLLDLDDLLYARDMAEAALAAAKGNDIEWFHKTVIGDALERQEIDFFDAIRRIERELEEINGRIFSMIERVWEEMYPDSPTLAEHQVLYTEVAQVLPFDPCCELMGKFWEEIFDDYGNGWSRDGMVGLASDVCVDMFDVLGVAGMRELVKALRRADIRRVTSLLARLSSYDRQKGQDFYNVVFAMRGGDGNLRLMIEQRLNLLHSASHQGRSGLAWFARGRRGARRRSSHGKAVRIRGSRRTSSRSAGGGSDDPDPEPLARRGAHDVVVAHLWAAKHIVEAMCATSYLVFRRAEHALKAAWRCRVGHVGPLRFTAISVQRGGERAALGASIAAPLDSHVATTLGFRKGVL